MKTAALALVALVACSTPPKSPADQAAADCLADARAEIYMSQDFEMAWGVLNACRNNAGLPPLKP